MKAAACSLAAFVASVSSVSAALPIIGDVIEHVEAKVPLPKNGLFPLECSLNTNLQLLYIQQTTDPVNAMLPNVKAQMPEVFALLDDSFPFGDWAMSLHRDKPRTPVGLITDFCYDLRIPMGGSIDGIVTNIDQMVAAGGGDIREDGLDALYLAARQAQTGWTFGTTDSFDRAIERVVVLVTNRPFHEPTDLADVAAGTIDAFTDNGLVDCFADEYPSQAVVASSLNNAGIKLIVLVGDANYLPTWTAFLSDNSIEGATAAIDFTGSDIGTVLIQTLQANLCPVDAAAAAEPLKPVEEVETLIEATHGVASGFFATIRSWFHI